MSGGGVLCMHSVAALDPRDRGRPAAVGRATKARAANGGWGPSAAGAAPGLSRAHAEGREHLFLGQVDLPLLHRALLEANQGTLRADVAAVHMPADVLRGERGLRVLLDGGQVRADVHALGQPHRLRGLPLGTALAKGPARIGPGRESRGERVDTLPHLPDVVEVDIPVARGRPIW